jgi:crotonobetainyl-CoA:carnitine CoA-transferase CaiB-like acyl-CoA transferase
MVYAALTDRPVPPVPARVSAWSVYKLFDTKIGEQVFMGIISEKHWQKFCEAFNRHDWLEDEISQKTENKIVALETDAVGNRLFQMSGVSAASDRERPV